MNPSFDKSRLLAIAIASIIAATGFLIPWLSESPHFNGAVFALAATLLTLDFVDLGVRAWISRSRGIDQFVGRGKSRISAESVSPYAIVLSVHNLRNDADWLLDALAPYKARTWIVDDCSTDQTVLYLNFKGWRCLSLTENLKKPGAIRSLLTRLPADIRTVVVLDPDAAPVDSGLQDLPDLERAVRDFQASGAAASVPRVRFREEGPLESCQFFECEMVFSFGRKGLSPNCITSGAAIYDRSSLASALERHSLCVYAEDFENSLILLGDDRHIVYDDDLVIVTSGKSTIRGLFSQRVGWFFGLIRVYTTRWREVLHVARRDPWTAYNFFVYLGILGILFLPIRAAGMLVLLASLLNALDQLLSLNLMPDGAWTDTSYFWSLYLSTTLMAGVVALYLRPPAKPSTIVFAVLFYFFYAMVNIAAAVVGLLNWVGLIVFGRRVYRDHYSADESSLAAAIHQKGKTA